MGAVARQLELRDALQNTIQVVPDPQEGAVRFGYNWTQRGPLLDAPGTRRRLWQQRQYWHHDYNELFKGAAAGAVKNVQSTPWEVRADDPEPWQTILMQADFGNWDRFVSKLVKDFLRYDVGAFIELIAPGDPIQAPSGPVVGLSILDPLRCYPTGNPEFPVIYYDSYNALHLMHMGRVVQFVDGIDSEESLAGYGESALSRCVGTIYREILMNRYIEQFLDDKPPPGVAVFGNLSQSVVEGAIEKMHQDNSTDITGEWGRTLRLYGLEAENKPTVDFISYSRTPEKFDYQVYTDINVKKIALGMNTDVLEIWELTRGGLGQGTQSEIMQQKSRGKLMGRLLKGLERTINMALPEDVEFSWQYKDPQEDIEEAEKAKTWTGIAKEAADITTKQEQRELIAQQVEPWRDVMSEDDGTVRRLPDDDPKAGNEPTPEEISQTATVDDSETVAITAAKEFTSTTADWQTTFADFVQTAQLPGAGAGALRAAFRNELHDAGMMAYEDGLRAGGVDPDESDALTKAERRRKVAEWLAVQNTFITNLVDDIQGREEPVSSKEIALRGQMWANKSLRSIYYAGLYEAQATKFFEWEYDPEKHHCATCLTLNGQVHSLKTWMKSGFTPGCTCLECGGYLCGCKFKATTAGSRGRIPGRTGLQTVIDQFSDFMRRLVNRKDTVQIDGEYAPDAHTAMIALFLRRVASEG